MAPPLPPALALILSNFLNKPSIVTFTELIALYIDPVVSITTVRQKSTALFGCSLGTNPTVLILSTPSPLISIPVLAEGLLYFSTLNLPVLHSHTAALLIHRAVPLKVNSLNSFDAAVSITILPSESSPSGLNTIEAHPVLSRANTRNPFLTSLLSSISHNVSPS